MTIDTTRKASLVNPIRRIVNESFYRYRLDIADTPASNRMINIAARHWRMSRNIENVLYEQCRHVPTQGD